MSTSSKVAPAVEYPDCDGEPMAENTLQFEWIVTIKEGLEAVFRDDPDVFVAGDLLWYPVEGDNTTRAAPDAMVAFGRPKGYRGSYKQWEEGGIAPQVVFEVLSPGNRAGEMGRKLDFYRQYGVEEYYLYDPDRVTLAGWVREGDALRQVEAMDGWTSPRLGVRFELGPETLRIIRPDGRPFLTYQEIDRARADAERRATTAERRATTAERRAMTAERRVTTAERRADVERGRAEAAEERAQRLAERLRALGIEPEEES